MSLWCCNLCVCVCVCGIHSFHKVHDFEHMRSKPMLPHDFFPHPVTTAHRHTHKKRWGGGEGERLSLPLSSNCPCLPSSSFGVAEWWMCLCTCHHSCIHVRVWECDAAQVTIPTRGKIIVLNWYIYIKHWKSYWLTSIILRVFFLLPLTLNHY